jgi:hypothetical protein
MISVYGVLLLEANGTQLMYTIVVGWYIQATTATRPFLPTVKWLDVVNGGYGMIPSRCGVIRVRKQNDQP